MTFFVISMSLSASLVQNQNNKSKINRNPPSYFLKRDGGFAYVISKPKKSPAGFHKLAGIIISKRCK